MHFYQNETGSKEKYFEFWLWYKLYKYEGMLAHSFDRFYAVMKFILPSIRDLNFSKLSYDNTCTYLDNKKICNAETKKHILDLIMLCKKIEPFVNLL